MTKAKKTEKQIKFKARAGAPFPKEKAEEVGLALEKIKDKNKGKLRTEDVLKEASKARSVLRPYFNWDDTIAAEKWRKHQARLLINHVEVVYMYNKVEESRPMYINITNTNETEEETPDSQDQDRAYVDYIEVATNEAYRQQAIKEALQQLIHWKAKYKWLNELHNIILEIDKEISKFDMDEE